MNWRKEPTVATASEAVRLKKMRSTLQVHGSLRIPWVMSGAKGIRRNMLEVRDYRFHMWICSSTDLRAIEIRSEGSNLYPKWDTLAQVAGEMIEYMIR
jgi:alpha-galactosidase